MSKRVFQIVCLIFLVVRPYAQDRATSAQSSLDWKTGLIHSVISLDTKKSGIVLPAGRNAALQILERDTPTLLKDTYFSVIVNSSERIGDQIASGQLSLVDLNRIIDSGDKTPPFFSRDLKKISMTHTVSLVQLGSLFVRHKIPYEPKAPLETRPSRAYSGIIIDARGSLAVHGEYGKATIVPCLFPRIWSADMDTILEKNMVNPDVAAREGIVLYTASTDESAYEERIGSDPLRIIARELYGQNRTDPVIDHDDYLKIVTIAGNRKLLKDGKVVILCDPASLDAGTVGPVKDDDYYFAWKSIEDRLNAKAVPKIDFSDTWEGLKLTIYDIRFAADTARLLSGETGRLDSIADALKLAGVHARFVIAGHTASVGKPGGELELSVRRAAAIADELVKRGIAASQITSTGYGGTKPAAANDTDEGRAKNRRVEITIELDKPGN
jgi:outer membrane protein OmpA-like peptidoglycan-associated protein